MKHVSTTLTLAVVATTTMVLLADAALLAAREADQHEGDARQASLALGGSVARMVQALADAGHPAAATEALVAVEAENPTVSIRWRPRMRLRRPDQFTERGFLHTLVPVPGSRGSIAVEQSLRPLERFRRRTLWGALWMAALLSAASALAIHVTSRFVIRRPLSSILDRLQQIGAGQLAGRLGIARRDEFGTIARRVDEMSEALTTAAAERAAAERERAAARAQVEHSNRLATVGRLAAGMAHELGSPLNVILVRSRMIERDGVPGSQQAVGAAQIARQVDRMTSILRQLLRYARPRQPERQSTDLSSLVRSTIEMLRPSAEISGVRIGHSAPDAIDVFADPGQLEQVLVNLVQNAVQALPDGGDVRVSLEEDRKREHVAIRVEDSGAGVDQALRDHVFDPFFTTKEVGQGTGLGLSVVHGIVQQHGGSITLSDSPLGGACFEVQLPTSRSHSPA